MKKIIIALIMGLSLLSFQSCKDTKIAFNYEVKINGDADGVVDIKFPGGTFGVDGKTGLRFAYSNVPVDTTVRVYNLEKALVSNDVKVAEAAARVSESLVSVTAASGTYYVHVKGFVKETLTGLTFEVDREFTNRPQEVTE